MCPARAVWTNFALPMVTVSSAPKSSSQDTQSSGSVGRSVDMQTLLPTRQADGGCCGACRYAHWRPTLTQASLGRCAARWTPHRRRFDGRSLALRRAAHSARLSQSLQTRRQCRSDHVAVREHRRCLGAPRAARSLTPWPMRSHDRGKAPEKPRLAWGNPREKPSPQGESS